MPDLITTVKQLRNEGLTQYQVADVLGVTQSYISGIENGKYSGRNRNLHRCLRHNAFTTQSPEADFWAGFIAADGSIRHDRHELKFGLQIRDVEFLKDFASWIGSHHKLGNYIDRQGHESCTLVFQSKQIITDLQRHYNIGPQKSLTLQPPNRKSMSFVSGYWMGNGHIELSSQRDWTTGFAGTPALLKWVRHFFCDLSSAAVRPMNAAWRLTYGGNTLVPQVCWRIFEHAPWHIQRKFDLYREMINE